MRLASHEVYDLNELTLSCVNSISSMAYMMEHTSDPELKEILHRHFPYHVIDYNTKVEILQSNGEMNNMPRFEMEGDLSCDIDQVASAAAAMMPRTSIKDFDDREMATNYLLTLKRAGREYAWVAMESAHPDVRAFLESAFLMCSTHAYEMWQYMAKKGYYPLDAAKNEVAKSTGNRYVVIPDDQMYGPKDRHLGDAEDHRPNIYQ